MVLLSCLISLATHVAAVPSAAWHKRWDKSVFQEAAQQNKWVLLDLNAVWCHWCHVMDTTTYRDARVRALLNEHFVLVSVDADNDPELASRYGDWGWPATIVLAADGSEIVKRRGYMAPAQFASLLQAIVDDPSPGPSVDSPAPLGVLTASRLDAKQQLLMGHAFDALYDDKNGGWGTVHKFVDAASIELSFLRADSGDEKASRRVRQTLSANLSLMDPVWGGVYQYSDAVDWRSPHFEKLMSFQADELRLYSDAYARWADPHYLQAAQSLFDYMSGFLSSPDGGFYASQDADVSIAITGQQFYSKLDGERRLLGMPRIDAHEYSRETAWAIRALCKYHDVTGDQPALSRALLAAHWILDHRLRSDGGFNHDTLERGGPFLGDSLAVAQAFLALYQTTGDRVWLHDGRLALDFIQHRLRDPDAGYLTAQRLRGPGVFLNPVRTPDENSALAVTANLAYGFTANGRYKSMATHAMRYLAAYAKTQGQPFRPDILVADYQVKTIPIHITVVGAKNDAIAQQLHAAALRYPSDYLQVEWWDRSEGSLPNETVHYPQLDRPAAFACSARACSMPIFAASDLASAVRRSLRDP